MSDGATAWAASGRLRASRVLAAATLIPIAVLATALPGEARARPTCFGKPATIVGNGNANRIDLTRGKDVVVAKGGNDVIKAGGRKPWRQNHGEDVICGGKGNDDLFGNNEKNTLIGGPGNDAINAGPSIDLMVGDNANPNGDESGPTGNDYLGGAGGNDFMVGDNYASGDAKGSSPDRRLHGAKADDTVIGGSASTDGNASGGGRDHLEGADGNDRVIGDSFAPKGAASGGGKDEVNTGPGRDVGVGDSYTVTGTAKGGGRDEVHGGDAGKTCARNACDDEFYGDNYAASCATTKVRKGLTVLLGCPKISGGGQDLVKTDQGADFLNGGPPNNPDVRPRQDICSGGSGRDTGTQCEFYKDVERKIRR
jgi:RTX calcium-binding nonapeptide repeat (4 copies)